MPKMKSQIFEDAAKILEAAGALKQAYPSLEAYKDDAEARAGSDSITAIEALYGVKPDTIDQQQYEHNIMEIAHPTSVVIAPSYDKLNGLVENNIERNNIMSNIALKPNNGFHSNHKYAKQELVMELVRIANEMDAKNNESLYKMADECLLDLQKQAGWWDDAKQFFKEKFEDVPSVGEGALAGAGIGALIGGLVTSWSGPGALVGVTAGAAIGALINSFTKTTPQVKNVAYNAQEVSNQLQDLIKKIPESHSFFEVINEELQSLIKAANRYEKALNALQTAAIKNDTSKLNSNELTQASKEFVEHTAIIRSIRAEFSRRAKAGQFAAAKPDKALTPVYWFISDDIEDVEDAFQSLENAIDRLESSSKDAVSTVKNIPSQNQNQSDQQAQLGNNSAIHDIIKKITGREPTPAEVEFLENLPK